MTCRGSRFADGAQRNPDGQVFMKNRETDEWLNQNIISTRNFIRKWGHFCKHDKFMKPIIPPKYNIGIILRNGRLNHLEILEPWCDIIYHEKTLPGIDTPEDYVYREQQKTSYIMAQRVKCLENITPDNDIIIEIDGNNFNQTDYQHIQQFAEILANDELEVGSFELGTMKIIINKLQTYEKDLIICKEQ